MARVQTNRMAPAMFPCGCRYSYATAGGKTTGSTGEFLRLGDSRYMCRHQQIWKVKTEWVEEKKGSK